MKEPTKAQRCAGYSRDYAPESIPKKMTPENAELLNRRRRIEDVKQGLELDREFAEVWD